MRRMNDTLFRQWHLLRAIPRQPQRRSTSQIQRTLLDEGYSVTARSVQRDLVSLSVQWGFTSETEGRTNYWFWPEGAKLLDVPNLGSPEALVFLLAHQYLQDILPVSMTARLQPYIKRAEQLITAEHMPLKKWMKRVRVIGRGPRLATPVVRAEVVECVHESLLKDRKLKLTYVRRGDSAPRTYELNPQALIVRDGLVYLVATASDYSDLLHFALHRAKAAEVLDSRAIRIKDFDLDDYLVRQQAFSYPDQSSGEISVVLRINGQLRNHLEERPLSEGQVITDEGESRAILKASVQDTKELRWWILGLGDTVEVVKPADLRKQIGATLKGAAARY